MVTKTHNYQQP